MNSLDQHTILITFFPDEYAFSKDEERWTLPVLADEIRVTSEARKDLLPWLKLARFGEARSRKNCLRTNANTSEVTGLEIDYDAGTMPFDAAVAAMRKANIRCLLYTSASYIAGEKEKWRVLVPFSKAYAPAYRAEMTAVVNGILGGVAAEESFNLSTAFYYGCVNNNPAHRVEVVDGDFVDLRSDLLAGGIGRPARAKSGSTREVTPAGVSPGRDREEILELIAQSRKKNPHGGGQWHNNMLSATASMIGKGWTDAEIYEACAPHCDGQWGDEEIREMIEDGRAKWKAPDPDKVFDRMGPIVAAAIEAKGGETIDFDKDFPVGTVRDDYYAFLPTHQYIYKHTGRLYPLSTINATLSSVTIGSKQKKQTKKQAKDGEEPETIEKKIPASLWLDRNRPVMEMSWAPGEPQLLTGKLACEGGWIERAGVSSYNLYRPPAPKEGNPDGAGRWVELVEKIYPDHAEHIIAFCAHRVQRPAEKINHGLVLTGSPGIGKDTLLEPLKQGVGVWNFREISPQDITGDYNDFMQSVVLRVSETRDLGDINRYKFYEATKTMLAAPPDTVRVNIKHIPQFYIPNVAGVIFTTNYPSDGLFLPPDDRRHYVCGTEQTRDEAWDAYCMAIWDWYASGGLADAVAYLKAHDLSGFDAKQPPVKTAAFWRMVDAGRPSEESEFRDVLDRMGDPVAVTIAQISAHADNDLRQWIQDRKNNRNVSRRLDDCDYVPIRYPDDSTDGRWKINGKRQMVYVQRGLSVPEQYQAAKKLKKTLEDTQMLQKGNVIPIKP